jgi:hypothetical protein
MIRTASIPSDQSSRRLSATAVAITCFGLLLHAGANHAQAVAGETFTSAQDAARALYRAARDDDRDALTRILGTGEAALSSEDPVADGHDRAQFVHKYEEMHRLVREPDGSEVLYVGAENWSFPFPIVAQSGEWHFDAESGMQEMVVRRIGADELAAIETCRALVASPAGVGTPNAADEDGVMSLQGYYFRRVRASHPDATVKTTGRDASNDASGTFAVVAYPEQYRLTGVMTFLVTPDGTVYERDLGANTVVTASRMTSIDPRREWRRVEGS